MSLKVAIGAIGACIALAGCVETDVYYSAYPDASLTPTFGTASLQLGQDRYVDIEAGGGFNAAAMATGCSGYIYGAPDYHVYVEGGGTIALVIAVAAYATEATVIVIGPSGQLYCSDESYGDNLDAVLTVPNARPGRYAIWTGTPTPSTYPAAFLGVALLSASTAASGNAAPQVPARMLN